ncbi:MAG: cell wall-binding repeat-containing protein [Acidimicrobiales bacterium]
MRQTVAAAASLTTGAAALFLGGAARAAIVAPSDFPPGVGLATTAYTFQFAGENREGTAAAIALNAAESKSHTGGYPFQATTPDANPASAAYGTVTCPKTLVLAADDTPADALAAAGLYGKTAVVLQDTAGKSATFDTKGAALVLTQSGREGATQLDTTTNAAIARIKTACAGAINGIVLGGTAAIPASVLDQFKAPLAAVARIAGLDRDDTARAIAVAVAGATGAALPTVTYFATPTSFGSTTGSSSLAKTVFLAEDQTGADALAVGAVAARLGVPVLLTSSQTLPQATANALTSLAPHNILVLGGQAAIADSVVATAKGFAAPGATAIRVFGANRYATGIAIAEQLLNLYPDYVTSMGANAYSDQLFGLARDEGSAAAGTHVGWPDALASAYYLAGLEGTSAPTRTVPAVNKSRVNEGGMTSTAANLTPVVCGAAGTKCSPAVPLLLTTGSSLVPEVDAYLKAMYPSGGAYKTGANPTGANDAGFGFVFGGSAAVSLDALAGMSSDLSGQTYNAATATDVAPVLTQTGVFYTTISLASFTGQLAGTTASFVGTAAAKPDPSVAKVCAMPGALGGVAGIEAVNDQRSFVATNPVDYYGTTVAYPATSALGSCVDLTTAPVASTKSAATFYGVSLSGNATPPVSIGYTPALTLNVQALGNGPSGNTDSGSIFSAIASGSSETETITYTAIPLQMTSYKGTSISGATADLTLKLTRTKAANSKDVISWTGSLTVLNGTTHVFQAGITQGITDVTPASTGSISSPLNLLGVYAAPGLGAIALTVSPPVVPGSVPQASSIQVSGNA